MARVGIRCEKPGELDDAIREMIDVDKPVIFDCLVDQNENCFPMIPSGKAHNEMLLGDVPERHRDGDRRRRARCWCDASPRNGTLVVNTTH